MPCSSLTDGLFKFDPERCRKPFNPLGLKGKAAERLSHAAAARQQTYAAAATARRAHTQSKQTVACELHSSSQMAERRHYQLDGVWLQLANIQTKPSCGCPLLSETLIWQKGLCWAVKEQGRQGMPAEVSKSSLRLFNIQQNFKIWEIDLVSDIARIFKYMYMYLHAN